MSPSFSLLRSSKRATASPSANSTVIDEKPPSYTDSSQSQDGLVKLRSPKEKGCSVRTLSVNEFVNDEKVESSGPSEPTNSRAKFQTFAFGPNNYYYCAVPPLDFAYQAHSGSFALTKYMDFAEIYWCAITPYGDELIAYKDKSSGLAMWTFQKKRDRPANAPTYTSLMRWLRKHVPHDKTALEESFVTFSPSGGYFARCPTACVWHDTPETLEDKMDKLFPEIEQGPERPIPELVSFGHSGTAMVVWADHAIVKNGVASLTLSDHFLRAWVDKNDGTDKIEMVSLSMDNSDDFFLCTASGRVNMTFRSATQQNCEHLLKNVLAFMQARAKEDRKSFVIEITTGDTVTNVSITPDTKWKGVSFQKR